MLDRPQFSLKAMLDIIAALSVPFAMMTTREPMLEVQSAAEYSAATRGN